MPKFQNPPQGGEKYICLTLFLTMMMSVVSAVAMIYSIVIIYLPSKAVLESNITGPAMCTTLSLERNIDSIEFCHNWSSCEEWCLSKVCSKKPYTHLAPIFPYLVHLFIPYTTLLLRHSIVIDFSLPRLHLNCCTKNHLIRNFGTKFQKCNVQLCYC